MTDDIWALRFEIEKAADIARPLYLVLNLRWNHEDDERFTATGEVGCACTDYRACPHDARELGVGEGVSMEAAMRDLLRVVKERNK